MSINATCGQDEYWVAVDGCVKFIRFDQFVTDEQISEIMERDYDNCEYGCLISIVDEREHGNIEYTESSDEESDEEELCPRCGDEWTAATRCDCPQEEESDEEGIEREVLPIEPKVKIIKQSFPTEESFKRIKGLFNYGYLTYTIDKVGSNSGIVHSTELLLLDDVSYNERNHTIRYNKDFSELWIEMA